MRAERLRSRSAHDSASGCTYPRPVVRDEGDQVVGSDWLGSTDAAARLGITPRMLYRLINDGKVPAYRIGRVVRFKVSDLDAFVACCRIEPGTLDYLHAVPPLDDDDD